MNQRPTPFHLMTQLLDCHRVPSDNLGEKVKRNLLPQDFILGNPNQVIAADVQQMLKHVAPGDPLPR